MTFRRRLTGVAVVATTLGTIPFAFGWGSYGHQQINSVALQLLDPATPIGACFQRNSSVITRYAITPDYEWKKLGKAPTDPELRRKKASNDYFEHPLHYFEPDAFIRDGLVTPMAVASLPSGPYAQAFPRYQVLRTENEAHVTKMDPHKRLRNPQLAATDEVVGHGTAPWRIRQLYRLGVNALKQGDSPMAMYFLGAMGHYVGDMSQPFHGSLNYDGKSTVTDSEGKVILPATPGIHSVFETKMLAEATKTSNGGKADPDTQMWRSFATTEKAVVDRARETMKGCSPLSEQNVTRATFDLVGGGFPYLEPLLKEYGKAIALHPRIPITPTIPHGPDDEDHGEQKGTAQPKAFAPSVAVVREFLRLRLPDPVSAKDGSMLDIATTRMGDGAALLARMWNSAYQQARQENPDMADISGCALVNFDQGFAIRNYPRPDYLPKGAYLPPVVRPMAPPTAKAIKAKPSVKAR